MTFGNKKADDWCSGNCWPKQPCDKPYDFDVGNKHYHFECVCGLITGCNCDRDIAWYTV